MEFIGVLRIGPSLSTNGRNCSWVEFRDLCSVFNVEQVAGTYCLGSAFLRRSIIKKGIRPRSDHFFGQWRWTGEVTGS